MIYLMGDIQGCSDALTRMLDTLAFSPSRDHLFVLGDMVNRGPDSLGTLRRLMALEGAATCLLGNHDLHLLAVAHGARAPHRSDTLGDILQAPDRSALLGWLTQRPLAVMAHGWLMVHAGVLPSWRIEDVLVLAREVSQQLRTEALHEFLPTMYGNEPTHWHPDLAGPDRLRCIVNTLTRARFITPDGGLELLSKEGTGAAPDGCTPWFDAPGRCTEGQPIAFGHWSTLGLLRRGDLLGLDTGCVWGGKLSAARIAPSGGEYEEVIQIRCEQACVPGRA
jgi:bis(5'-nucleosyl)-tetraphosphatase (symmetrical)